MSRSGPADPGPTLEHEYDGIREYDNPMPAWWKLTFLATVLFSVGYWFWYHGGPGVSELEAYERARQAHDQRTGVAAAPQVDEVELAALFGDDGALSTGQEVYQNNCASCHGPEGAGLVGPNLTDDYQIHGESRTDLYETIANGVPDKGMIPWAPVLDPEQLAAVTAYVGSMRHTNRDGGKPPEGEPVPPFEPL